MIVIKRTYNWEMGHALLKVGKEDKCYGPHGHNYRLIIEISDSERTTDPDLQILDPDTDMVINFHQLDIPIKELITDHYDHKFYANEDDDRFEVGPDIANVIMQEGDPTAENLLLFLGFTIRKLMILNGLQLESIELYETDKASAKIYYT